MKFMKMYRDVVDRLKSMESLPLFLIRVVLAYGFFEPAKMKWQDINSVASWFDSMGFPLPTLNAYLAALTEGLGVVLLVLGLGTRIISIPLIIVMLVAIFTVHWSHGFAAGDNGYEIPLYYLIMLLTLVIFGGGKWSLDRLINNNIK